MRVVGIIAEYNPFHQGHALQLAEAKRKSEADYAVVVMSGAVTQRGVFARHDKFLRTRAALMGGADLVLELPVRFACAPAPDFARGGTALLAALGVVTHLSFGCEPEAIGRLSAAAAFLREESLPYKEALHAAMDRGLSWPAASMQALNAVTGEDWSCLANPNAVLALEYLRHLRGMEPVPVARQGERYDSLKLSRLASASAIRHALEEGRMEEAYAALPYPTLFRQAEDAGHVHLPDSLDRVLLARLRRMKSEEIAELYGVDEGIEHAFAAAARKAGTRDALIALVKSRRYTWARLSRVCTCALLGFTKDFAAESAAPAYARILGFRKSAQPLLHAVRVASSVPLVAKCADFDREQPQMAMDLLAQDLWALGCAAPDARGAGLDFTTSPVIEP